MPKPRSQTPQPRPNSDSPEEPPKSLPLFRLTFLGSSRHVLNWRTADFRQLKEAEAGKFLRTHPNLVVETPLVDPGNFYPYRKPGDETIAMKRFSLTPENRITVLPWGREPSPGTVVISTSIDLIRATHRWSPTRLAKIWNSLPGVEPVRKFDTRYLAVSSIWYRIQSLEATPETAPVAREGSPAQPEGNVTHSSASIEKQLAKPGAKRDSCRDRNQRQGPIRNMKRFSIDANNAVTVLPAREPAAPGSTVFQTEPELLAASAEWTSARLLAIWNKLPGVEPVRKFRSRAAAAARIWQQIQTLPTSAPHPARKAREKSAAKQTAAVSTSSTTAGAPASKKDQVLAMLRAAQGATLTEMMPYASHCTSLA